MEGIGIGLRKENNIEKKVWALVSLQNFWGYDTRIRRRWNTDLGIINSLHR